MRYSPQFTLVWMVFWIFLMPFSEKSQGLVCEKLKVGGSYTLQEQQNLTGNLCLIGGVGNLEAGSFVDGDALLIGGTLHINGTITGSVKALAGVVELEENGQVRGDVILLGSQDFGMDPAMINGEVRHYPSAFFTNIIPSSVRYSPSALFGPIWNLVWLPIRSLLWVGLAFLIYLLFPKILERIGQTAFQQFLPSAGIGSGTVVIGILASVFLTLTIICIPFSILILLAFLVAWLVGTISLGRELGIRMEKLFNQRWTRWVSLGVGVFCLTLFLNAFTLAIPVIGWLFKIFVGAVGLGAVILTRFGSQAYPLYILPDQDA